MNDINVLAVLRHHAVAERDRLGTTDNDTQAALAAVVKLMEEAGNVIEWISDYVPDGVGGREAELRELRAALARCRGGAALRGPDFFEGHDMTANFYAITNESDNNLFWSNEYGWVDTPTYDLFTREEREALNLPVEGRWVQVAWKEEATK